MADEDEDRETFREWARKLVVPSPKELFDKLESLGYRGQVRARRALCLMAHRHIKRIKQYAAANQDAGHAVVGPPKLNYLMMGPTGSGKTHLVDLLFVKILKVPVFIADMTNYSQTGYHGMDVIKILKSLITVADGNRFKAECGVVCLDEFDKTAGKRSEYQDVSGYGVQRELLKMLDGARVDVPEGHDDPSFQMSTSHISFIACGAFSGFKTAVRSIHGGPNIGFLGAADKSDSEQIAAAFTEEEIDNIEHFKKFGFMPELIARFRRVVTFDPLDEQTLLAIVQSEASKHAAAEFAKDGLQLNIEPAVFSHFVHTAVKTQIGARGLQQLLAKELEPVMYDLLPVKSSTVVNVKLEEGRVRCVPESAGSGAQETELEADSLDEDSAAEVRKLSFKFLITSNRRVVAVDYELCPQASEAGSILERMEPLRVVQPVCKAKWTGAKADKLIERARKYRKIVKSDEILMTALWNNCIEDQMVQPALRGPLNDVYRDALAFDRAHGRPDPKIWRERGTEIEESVAQTDVHILTEYELEPMFFADVSAQIRFRLANEFGLILPQVETRVSHSLPPRYYEILIRGMRRGRGELRPDRLMAIGPATTQFRGDVVREPVSGQSGIWIDPDDAVRAFQAGCTVYDPPTVIAKHLEHALRQNAWLLVSREHTESLLDIVKDKCARLAEEVEKGIGARKVTSVLRELVREHVPIKDITLILDTLLSLDSNAPLSEMVERVRHVLAPIICDRLAGTDGVLHAIEAGVATQAEMSSPEAAEQAKSFFAESIAATKSVGRRPVIIAPPTTRRAIYEILSPENDGIAVLSESEVDVWLSLSAGHRIVTEKMYRKDFDGGSK
ncbi:MAG: hypothetical protein A3G34_07180 [Candidatus Lindowbacteria bacterium RIFCSPLOWO2_12_FULL_62_27]|nr:MAG: hypothetical protein A3G34_07180 [Candidatus Lindowbacteria bacterium RIFCSPLOWO2_12_FULL_62_27]OGH61815.1 MAG: hypothetical protein A3I06_09370 [Candidatus Lindowbacteria bacterium RIFCSPLOWO2_02_FULL_62_12]